MTFIDTINKKVLIILAIIVAIIATFIVIYVQNNNNQKGVTKAPIAPVLLDAATESFLDIKKNDTSSVNIKTTFKLPENTPQTLPIYEYSKPIVDDTYVKNLNFLLDVIKTSENTYKSTGRIVSASKNNRTVDYYTDQGYFIYTNNVQENEKVVKFTKSADINTYEKKAKEELDRLNIDTKSYLYTNFAFLDYPNMTPDVLNNLEGAGLIEFIYTKSINNIPVVEFSSLNATNSKISVWIDSKFVIRRIDAKLDGKIGNNLGEIPLKSQIDLTSDVVANKAQIVDSDASRDEKIAQMIVNKATLSYFYKDNKLVPIYVLSASLATSDGRDGTALLYVEAISK